MSEKETEKKSCANCYYFLNCKTNENDPQAFCERNPDIPGYCELWTGPVKNMDPCYGWMPREK
ncbi:MAG: hypothetical protein ACTSVU_04370 [Promethearchaeota archaeon]